MMITLDTVIDIGLYISIAVTILSILFAIFRKKIKRGHQMITTELKIDYGNLKRADALDYIKFDSIKDFQFGGVLVDEKERRFTVAMEVTGYDYYFAPEDKREQSRVKMKQFAFNLERPIQIRQSTRRIDLDYMIKETLEKAKKYEEKLQELEVQEKYLLEQIKQTIDLNSNGEYNEALEELERQLSFIDGEIFFHTFSKDSLYAQSEYIENRSGNNIDPIQETHYIFDYRIKEDSYYYEDTLENKLIHSKDILWHEYKGFDSYLQSCGLSTKIISAKDYLQLLRKHMHPKYGEYITAEQLLNSSYTSAFLIEGIEIEDEEENLEWA